MYVDRKKRPLGHAPNIKRSTSTCVPTSPPTSDEFIRQNHPLRLVINSRIKGRTFSYPFAQIAGTPAFSFAGVCFFSNFSVMASCRATSSSNNQCTHNGHSNEPKIHHHRYKYRTKGASIFRTEAQFRIQIYHDRQRIFFSKI